MDQEPPSNDTFANLSGERGDEAQFESMQALVKQLIAVTMGRIQFIPAEGAAVIGGSNPLLFVP
jgi:hypothetical protein